jgi:hypothetical protein
MARIPAINRLVQEDFKDQPWIGKLIQPLNTFMTETIQAFNKGLTLSENSQAMVTTQRVKSGSPLDFSPVTFTSTIGRPVGVYVVQCVDVNYSQVMTAPVNAAWSYNPGNGLISLDYVTGIWDVVYSSYATSTTVVSIVSSPTTVQVGHEIVSPAVPAGTRVKSITSYNPFTFEMTASATTGDTELSEFTGKTYDLTLVVLGG